MTRTRILLFALAVLIAAPGFAQAPAGIAGDWDLTINSPQGANTTRVTFTQEGDKITGLFKSANGQLPFTGTMTGNDLKFGFSINVQGMALDITMTGKLEGETMTGKADFGGMAEGDWTGKRATTAAATPAPEPTPPSSASTTGDATTTAGSTTSAAGFGGKWDVLLKTPAGDFPASATITDEGGKLTGTFGSQMGEVPVSGTTEGNALKIEMVAQTPQGSMKVVLTGDLHGDEIVNGKADVEGMGQMEWTAKRAKQ